MLKVILLLGVFFCVGVGENENNLRLLLTDIFNMIFPIVDNVSENCRRDFNQYIRGILQGETWALRMFDSMEKIPVGLLLGRALALGQFEECLSAVHSDFKGQHCMVDFSPKNVNFSLESLHNNLKFRNIDSSARFEKRQFGFGVCLPSTCNSTDLKSIIAAAGLNEIFNAEVDERDCIAHVYQEFRQKDYLALALLFFIVLVAVASTIYDVRQTENKGTQNVILKSFSLRWNSKILFNTTRETSEMGALNGIRYLSMAWVILGHCSFYSYFYGVPYNTIQMTNKITRVSALPETNAFLSVDSFFFLSGLLVCFVFFREISKKGSYDFPVAFIHRYFRLTPPILVMLLINITIFSRIVTGPFSKSVGEYTEQACHKYWWTYFLHIQNFYIQTAQCFGPGWYVAADTQMYFLSPVIMYVLLFRPKLAPAYFGLLILGSSLASFIGAFQGDLPPNYALEFIKGVQNLEYFFFFTRMVPWVVGFGTGYILCGIRSKKIIFQPTKFRLVVGWVASAFLCLGSLYGLAPFLPPAPEKSRFERSAYRSFHRLGWALGLSWIVIACVEGYGGLMNKFLSQQFFRPLAKLTYCMYLIHVSLLKYHFFQVTVHSEHSDIYSTVFTYAADLLIITLLAVPTTLLFEMPFINLSKAFLQHLEIFPYPKSDAHQPELNKKEKTRQLELEKGVKE